MGKIAGEAAADEEECYEYIYSYVVLSCALEETEVTKQSGARVGRLMSLCFLLRL